MTPDPPLKIALSDDIDAKTKAAFDAKFRDIGKRIDESVRSIEASFKAVLAKINAAIKRMEKANGQESS